MKLKYFTISSCICTIFLLFIMSYVLTKSQIKIEQVESIPQHRLSSRQFVTGEVVVTRQLAEIPIVKRTQEGLDKLNNISAGSKLEEFLLYKQIIDEYSDVLPPQETIYDCLSAEDIYLLQRVTETETNGADFDSKCNVVSVVINRFEDSTHKDFPGTISEIVMQDDQFDYWRTEIEEETILAVEYVWVMGDTAQGALWFDSAKDSWARRNREALFTDTAGHTFYK